MSKTGYGTGHFLSAPFLQPLSHLTPIYSALIIKNTLM